MPNDINELDVNDIGLKGIFGDRFHDETKPVSKKETTTTTKPEKPVQKPILKPRDAEREPAPHEPTQMEKLKACAKDALLFGGLSLLFFYFQQSGQMAMSASMPCICACCVLMGLGVGKNVR
jgi:hypothetical protein